MVARIDPNKAYLFPEELPEAIVTTATASGTAVANYSGYDDYVTLILKQLMSGQTPATTLRIDADNGHALFESPLIARPDRQFVPVDLLASSSLDLVVLNSTFRTYLCYTLRVTKLTIFEKLKYGLSLDESDIALAAEFGLQKKLKAGMLRYVETPQFKKIYEVARNVTVTAGSNTRVGSILNVKKGEKAVILGMACDPGFVDNRTGGPGPDNTYITLNRDVTDLAYVQLDCLAMPSINTEVPCYIPAIDRHEIIVESTAGVTSMPVRYRYGVADISLLEKVRWNLKLTKDEKAIADEFDLESAAVVGMI